MKNNVKNEIKKLVKRQSDAYSTGLVDSLRTHNSKYYELVELNFSFGTRKCFKKKNQEEYELLQGSRGGSCPLEGDKNYSEDIEILMQEPIEEIKEPNYRDYIRIKELENVSNSEEYPEFDLSPLKSFVELGFRVPRLMKYYKEQGMTAFGYDVLDLNIATGKYLGYDARRYDFDDCSEDLDLDADLVVSYHMLEHVTNPLIAVKKVYESMNKGAFFHVEIPIEPGTPNIRYCHMFPFEPKDMAHMLIEAGFRVLTVSNSTHEGGQHIERYLAVKEQ